MSKEGKQMNHLLKKGTVLFMPAGLLALSVTVAAAQTVTPVPGEAAATGGWLGWPWWVWILLGLLLVVLLWWIFGRRQPSMPPEPPAARRVTTPAPPAAPLPSVGVYDAPESPVTPIVPESPAVDVMPMSPVVGDVPEPPMRAEEPVMMATDDLKRIEGIGPRIEGILNNAGISTFAALSSMPVEQLRDIMNAAELRGSFGDPSSWPAQARLAAEGRWDELRTMQDGLKGGR